MAPCAACLAGAPSSSCSFRARRMTVAAPPAANASTTARTAARHATSAVSASRSSASPSLAASAGPAAAASVCATAAALSLPAVAPTRYRIRAGDAHCVQRRGVAHTFCAVEAADQPLSRPARPRSLRYPATRQTVVGIQRRPSFRYARSIVTSFASAPTPTVSIARR
eukprot:6190885-Pleurochrysis_carterae.AAC.7